MSDVNCSDKDTVDYVKAVVKALDLGNQEVLLAVAWTTAEGRLYHKKFPRVLGVDVKYGTNNERRPLLRLNGRTANDKIFSVMDCYMPNEMMASYFWGLYDALINNTDEMALKKTSIIPSDQDREQLDAIRSILQMSDKPLGDAALVLCKWHLVSLISFLSAIAQ